jgi:hypothetical protein
MTAGCQIHLPWLDSAALLAIHASMHAEIFNGEAINSLEESKD